MGRTGELHKIEDELDTEAQIHEEHEHILDLLDKRLAAEFVMDEYDKGEA